MSKKKTPIMPVDVGAYLGDTGHLSALEHGAYWLLMLHYWQNRGLPSDERAIARITGLSADEWAAARDTLHALFKIGDWKHKRIESDLTETARLSAAGRAGGRASGVKRRSKAQAKSEASNDHATIVQRFANDPPTKREALKKESKEERTLEPRGSNGADAPPIRPVYTDSRHELWGEGKLILRQLGLTEQNAGKMIGQWLKAMKDDDQAVLGAIQRARDNRVLDPIPWITRALKPGSKADVAESRSLVAAARRVAQSLVGSPDLGDGDGQPLLRLLPQG